MIRLKKILLNTLSRSNAKTQKDNVVARLSDVNELRSDVNEVLDTLIKSDVNILSSFYDAIRSGSVNVVFVGTSITEGINAQMEGYNIWVENFMRGLTSKFPNIEFTYTNLGLGSRKLSDLVNPYFIGVPNQDPGNSSGFYRAIGTYSWQTPSVIGKSWIDHIKDQTPDLVILNFGMNSSSSSPDTFQNNLEKAISTFRGYTKSPSIVLLTEMLPTLNSDPYLDNNGKIKLLNERIRTVAKTSGTGLIDVERNWQLLRDGKDPLIVQRTTLTLDSFTQITGGSPADVLTFNSMEETTNVINYAIQKDIARVVNMTCTYTPKSAASTLQMGVRYSKAKNEQWNAGVVIQLRNADITFYENAASVQVTPHTAITATNPHTVEFSFALDTLTVKVDSVVIGTYTVSSKFDFGNLSFGGTDFLAEDVVILLEDSNPIVTTAKYTNNELVGNKTASAWNLGDKRDGGNSINHPSRVGLAEAFYPAINLFIDNL